MQGWPVCVLEPRCCQQVDQVLEVWRGRGNLAEDFPAAPHKPWLLSGHGSPCDHTDPTAQHVRSHIQDGICGFGLKGEEAVSCRTHRMCAL